MNFTLPIKLSDHHHQAHGIPKGKCVAGHHITITGKYFARALARDSEGPSEKCVLNYTESFTLPPNPQHLHAQNALSHVLADLLPARLREKNPGFRGIKTHRVAIHTNVLVYAPAKKDKTEETTDDGSETDR
jgi:hypothetical protein